MVRWWRCFSSKICFCRLFKLQRTTLLNLGLELICVILTLHLHNGRLSCISKGFHHLGIALNTDYTTNLPKLINHYKDFPNYECLRK